MRVVLVAEQLRRTVPGGIGTYVRGLVKGLGDMGGDAPDLTLWASRLPARRDDPVIGLGLPTVISSLPPAALVRSWDEGWSAFAGAADVVHAPSLAVPPRRRCPLAVTVHDLAWRQVPEAFPSRGRRWHEAALGRALARASLLITPSRATADALVAPGYKAAGLLDTAVVVITYDNGARAVAEASFSASYGYDVRGEVFGSAGMVSAGDGRRTAMVLRDQHGLHQQTARSDVELMLDTYTAEFVEFVTAVREKREPSVTGRDARRALAVALASITSCQENAPVAVGNAR